MQAFRGKNTIQRTISPSTFDATVRIEERNSTLDRIFPEERVTWSITTSR